MGACNSVDNALPTLAPTRVMIATLAPLVTSTASPTVGISAPIASPTLAPSATLTNTVTPSPILTATPTVTLAPSATFTPLPDQFFFGKSAGERNLRAVRIGTGAKTLMLVGGIHAGFEINTIRLMNEVIIHFQSIGVPDGITLLIVPVLNVDGYTLGESRQGRFNDNFVDLNRNWGCNWSSEAFFREDKVNAGSEAFSEPETQALGALIQQVQPYAVLFYHAAARGVFAGNCGGSTSQEVARLYGDASGYPYGESFGAYPITGTAPNWVDSLGIASADIELASADSTEFTRNLRALQALIIWLQEQP